MTNIEDRATPLQKSFARRAKRVKRFATLQEIVGCYVDLRPAGTRLVALCPLHDEETPSFTVYPDTATFFCFGCRASGDVITFLMQKASMAFTEALETLERYIESNDTGTAA